MSLFDAFSTRDSSVKTNTTVTQDSYNVSQSETSVYDNLGNVTLTMGAPGNPIDWSKVLPIVAIGAVGLALATLILKRR
jgi:hypothetical protein